MLPKTVQRILDRFILIGAWIIGTIVIVFQLHIHCLIGIDCTTKSSEQGVRDVLSLVVGTFNAWIVVVWLLITTVTVISYLMKRRSE